LIDTLVENLWKRLQSAFEPLIILILALDSRISHSVGQSNNDAFPLRAYVAFMVGEDEIAVTIDLQNSNGQLTIGADICCDHGKILAEGPSVILGNINELKTVEDKLNEFLTQEAEHHLQNFMDAGRKEMVPFDTFAARARARWLMRNFVLKD